MITISKDKSTHLAVQLADVLRSAIAQGEYVAGRLIPSEHELCKQSGLSRTTVRRAIQLLVDDGLLYRVPGSGTFVGGSAASVGGTGASKAVQTTLGLLIPTLANPYYAELSRVIEREAHTRGFNLVVGQSDYVAAQEMTYLSRFAENTSISGVIAVPCGSDQVADTYRELAERGVPFIFLVRGVEGIDADEVETDHIGGAQAMVRHLIELGHRRIAYVGTTRGLPHRHLEGYRRALLEAGIPEAPELMVTFDTDDETAGREGARLLIERGVDVTAIFARVDITAAGVLQTLREHGVRVPDDISVAGFDNTQLAAHAHPPLTTVEHMRDEIGRLAVLFLLDRIEGRYGETSRRVIVQPRLVLRASCAPPHA
jgi:LacI family transcriptional regulator